MKLRSELLRSSSVPMVDSHVATESLVTCEESLLVADVTPRRHSASAMRSEDEHMQVAGRCLDIGKSVGMKMFPAVLRKRVDVLHLD